MLWRVILFYSSVGLADGWLRLPGGAWLQAIRQHVWSILASALPVVWLPVTSISAGRHHLAAKTREEMTLFSDQIR